jgi:hypothetical protein
MFRGSILASTGVEPIFSINCDFSLSLIPAREVDESQVVVVEQLMAEWGLFNNKGTMSYFCGSTFPYCPKWGELSKVALLQQARG